MGENRQIFHAERFQIIYVNAYHQRGELYTATSFQRVQYGKKKKSHFIVKKTD